MFLFLIAVGHHTREFLALGTPLGPLLALLLDGVPALALAYAGYRLSKADFSPQAQWTMFRCSMAGSALFLAVIGVSLLIRLFEGRGVTEPLFPLLIGVEAGGIAGLVAGYYSSQARMRAREARTASNALAFTNDLIRHDLRNDLNLIQGHADLLAESSGATEPTDGDPEIIAEKADEALTRIETSRVISDTLIGQPDLEPLDLVPIVAELAAHIRDAYRVTVTTDLPEEAYVVANVGVRSVVDNLLENAVEHNDAADPRVEVGVETGEETVRLTVRDNGSGIADDVKETIFETGEGSAGGLSLVRTLVDGYSGDVRVEDNDLGGSTFVVELPRAAGKTAEDGDSETDTSTWN